jgi:hypothetical protein
MGALYHHHSKESLQKSKTFFVKKKSKKRFFVFPGLFVHGWTQSMAHPARKPEAGCPGPLRARPPLETTPGG